MKFLQKHRDQSDVSQLPRLQRKKRKVDKAHAREEEISAYFSSVRPALAEQKSNTQAKDGSHQKLRGHDRSERSRSDTVHRVVPTVEPVDKPSYPGYGGRGPHHDNGSYISWSETVRLPSTTPGRLRIEPAVDTGQLDPVSGGREAGNTYGGGLLHSPPAPPTVTNHLPDGSGQRIQVPSLPTNGHPSQSHPLPKYTSSPRLAEAGMKRETRETVTSRLSIPPFVFTPSDYGCRQTHIPHIPAITEAGVRSHAVQVADPTRRRFDRIGNETEQYTPGEGDHETSLGRRQIIQDCNREFTEWRRTEAQSRTQRSSLRAPVESARRSTFTSCPTFRNVLPVRGSVCVKQDYDPDLSTVSGLGIYEQQEHRQYGYKPGGILPTSNVSNGGFFKRADYDSNYRYHEQNRDDTTYGQGPLMNDDGYKPDVNLRTSNVGNDKYFNRADYNDYDYQHDYRSGQRGRDNTTHGQEPHVKDDRNEPGVVLPRSNVGNGGFFKRADYEPHYRYHEQDRNDTAYGRSPLVNDNRNGSGIILPTPKVGSNSGCFNKASYNYQYGEQVQDDINNRRDPLVKDDRNKASDNLRTSKVSNGGYFNRADYDY